MPEVPRSEKMGNYCCLHIEGHRMNRREAFREHTKRPKKVKHGFPHVGF